MNTKLQDLKTTIETIDVIPQEEELFGGANLIISDDKDRYKKDHDVLVVSEYAKEISWFVYQLKRIFSNDLDYMNKYAFYPHIGILLNEAISEGKKLREQMIYALEYIGEFRRTE